MTSKNKFDWEAEVTWCISRASSPYEDSLYIDLDELLKHKPYPASTLREHAPKELLSKLDEILHANMLKLGRANPALMDKIIMQNLKSKHGYTERVDMTSKGEKVTIALPENLLPKELTNKPKELNGE